MEISSPASLNNDAKTATTATVSFFQRNFPGALFGLAHGSFIYPPNATRVFSHGQEIPAGRRLLDLIVVVPDVALPAAETLNTTITPTYGLGHDTPAYDPATITAAEFHSANMRRFPQHYSSYLRNCNPLEIARIQRTSQIPVLYFPLVDLPTHSTNPNHTSIRCKYGVTTMKDLSKDIQLWDPFHLAGRLHKAFLSFSANAELAETPFEPPPELKGLVDDDRLNALKVALGLLPEQFTFAELLRTVAELSYLGDIRHIVGETASRKATELLQAQSLQLSYIYLKLLVETPVFLGEALDLASVPRSLSNDQSVGRNNFAETLSILKGHYETSARAAAELIKNGATEKSQISGDLTELSRALLSADFRLRQDASDERREAFFNSLPANLKSAATRRSGALRVRTLFSPFSLLSAKRVLLEPGRPRPYDAIALRGGLSGLTRESSMKVALKSARTVDFKTCTNYVIQKLSKSLLRL